MISRQPLDLPYIHIPNLTGNAVEDAYSLLYANDRSATALHCKRVAELSVSWAERWGLDIKKSFLSGILHDISAVLKPADMMAYAAAQSWRFDASEIKYPFLLHQRVSAAIACKHLGINDEDVLSAIACHTTLKSDASEYDMLLFIADKLSWDQQGEPPYTELIAERMELSLHEACLAYIDYTLENDMVLMPHKWYMQAHGWLMKVALLHQ